MSQANCIYWKDDKENNRKKDKVCQKNLTIVINEWTGSSFIWKGARNFYNNYVYLGSVLPSLALLSTCGYDL